MIVVLNLHLKVIEIETKGNIILSLRIGKQVVPGQTNTKRGLIELTVETNIVRHNQSD